MIVWDVREIRMCKNYADKYEHNEVLPAHYDKRKFHLKPEAVRHRMTADEGYLTEEMITKAKQYTDAMVELVDSSVGRLIDYLKREGLWESTIFVFTSDHGDYLGDHWMLRKSHQNSAALNHVPLILHAPGRSLPHEVALPVGNADLTLTLCHMCGVKPPEGVQGRNMEQVIEDNMDVPVYAGGYTWNRRHHNFSVYDSRYHFSYYPGTMERELYDHAADPHEMNNVAGVEEYRQVEERLYRTLLEQHIQYDQPSIGMICLVWG